MFVKFNVIMTVKLSVYYQGFIDSYHTRLCVLKTIQLIEHECLKSVHLTGVDYSYNSRPQVLSDRTMVIHASY